MNEREQTYTEQRVKKVRKPSAFEIIRHIVQLIAFLLFPGLFISIFAGLKTIYISVIAGTFSASVLMPQILLVVSVILITAVMGRFFCSFLCSFGAMGDLLMFIGRKLHLPHIAVPEEADSLLKKVKYIVLVFIVIISWTLGISIMSGADPWTVFGMYATIKGWPGASYLLTAGGLILAGIIAASLLIDRFFCRYLCPLGAIFVLVSQFRLFRIRKPRKNCGRCSACTRRCPMAIPLYQDDRVSSGECIDCFACAAICPRDNVKANPTPAAAALITAASITGMYYVGNLAAANVPVTNTVSSSVMAEDSSSSTAASSSAGSTASSGSTGSAAGSTQSSTQSSTSGSTSDSTNTGTSSDSSSTAASDSGLTDGVYTGSGTGLRGTTTVEVTVSGGKITEITVKSYQDDSEFFNRAKSTIISEVIQSQSVNVNTVSGATYSSNGILEAVADALNISFTNPNSSLTGGGTHGK